MESIMTLGAMGFCIHRYNFQGILESQVLFPQMDEILGTAPFAKRCREPGQACGVVGFAHPPPLRQDPMGERQQQGFGKNWGLPGDATCSCDQRWGGKCQRAVASAPKQDLTGGFPSPSDPHGGVLSPSQIHNTPQVLEDQWVPILGCHLCPRVCPTS